MRIYALMNIFAKYISFILKYINLIFDEYTYNRYIIDIKLFSASYAINK